MRCARAVTAPRRPVAAHSPSAVGCAVRRAVARATSVLCVCPTRVVCLCVHGCVWHTVVHWFLVLSFIYIYIFAA